MTWFFCLLGCLEPFPTDRHDLVELRIAAMGADDAGNLRAFTWEGTEAWSAEAPGRVWGGDVSCVDSGCVLEAPGEAELTLLGVGGAHESGVLVVAEGAQVPTLNGFTRTLGEAGGSVVLDVPDAARVHFMAPAGAISETGFAAATYVAPGPGVWPLVALWMDGLGGNDWATIDIPVGVSGPFLVVGGRLFPVDTDVGPGPVSVLATVTPADDLTGFTLTDVTIDDGSPVDSPCGATAAGWDPDAVIERVCGRDEVAGARVRIVGEGMP